MTPFDGIKVFTASMLKEREDLSNRVNTWLEKNKLAVELVDREIRQSSDSSYHCLSIILFYKRKASGQVWEEPPRRSSHE